MPVLFYDKHSTSKAVAYTIDHVNCLVDANTVFTGDAHCSEEEIFMGYVKDLFEKAGYTDVNDANSLRYHDKGGDIHCGTNVQRTRPTYKWWE